MPQRIEKGDYAILHAVRLEEWSAWLLAQEDTMAGINAHFHGLADQELFEHFFRLWNHGLIECSLDGFESSAATPDPDLARQHLRDRLDCPLVYRLSKAGGKIWEDLASADWSRFFMSQIGSATNEWTLSASKREAIELAKRYRRIGPVSVEGTEKWDILQPWQATYWKELPLGHRLTFQYEHWDMPERVDDEEVKIGEEFSHYWTWYVASMMSVRH